MILLDTQMWIWLIQGSSRLTTAMRDAISSQGVAGALVSVISCWEVAKKVQRGKLELDRDVALWIYQGLAHPSIEVVGLSPRIMIEANSLPGEFHRDPADQMIVATARILDVPILTADSKILAYPHVRKVAVT